MASYSKLFSFALGIFCLFASLQNAQAQNRKRYIVYLKEKNTTAYSLDKPEKFLTARSIERRKKQNIAFNKRDLPVDEAVIKSIQAKGARVWYASRWLNAVLIEATTEELDKVKTLPTLKPEVEMVCPIRSTTATNPKPLTDATFKNNAGKEKNSLLRIDSATHYGKAFNQANMLGVPDMHRWGYRGQGIYIAVLDAGFENGDKVSFIKHLHEDGRILGTYNFVEGQENVYNTGSHGLEVLSCIGSYEFRKHIGTAPEASFYLFRTEDAETEYRVEEFNWLVAAEKADSLGVDVLNSSLGYTDFDTDSQDYTYKDMNGKKSICSRAATWAAGVGMIVVNSAGNEGGGGWKYIGAPADADSILAIGSVDTPKQRSYFSSFGPTYDKRLKPNLCAQGNPASVGKPSGNISFNSGTSFSSPILCGMVASFWQAFPQLTNMEIIEILQQSGSQATKPDSILGYGVPNFKLAYELAQIKTEKAKTGFHVFPNPLPEGQAIRLVFSDAYIGKKLKIEITNMKGNTVEHFTLDKAERQYEWSATAKLPKGLYAVRVIENKKAEARRWLKE